jgi:hypothetical protein
MTATSESRPLPVVKDPKLLAFIRKTVESAPPLSARQIENVLDILKVGDAA